MKVTGSPRGRWWRCEGFGTVVKGVEETQREQSLGKGVKAITHSKEDGAGGTRFGRQKDKSEMGKWTLSHSPPPKFPPHRGVGQTPIFTLGPQPTDGDHSLRCAH